MKILLLSFYYPPDLCPGSFRASAMVQALLEVMPAGAQLDVVTTMPNRYSKFTAEAPEFEDKGRLTIRRIKLPPHQSGMKDQSKAFIAYAKGVRRFVNSTSYDIVCATSSRLMTAVLGAMVARKQKAPLYLDIRDIFSDTIKDVLPKPAASVAKPLFSMLERWTMQRATHINLVSAGFAEYFHRRYPNRKYSFHTNGIDDEFVPKELSKPDAAKDPKRRISVLYAGNLGEGQGLHSILPRLAREMRDRVEFTVVGDGGRRRALEEAVESGKIDNITLLPPMKRLDLIDAYRAADVLFVHLNDYDAFKKVLPSKLFEYGAIGKPIWAGVDGYAAKFVREEIPNAEVFYPCNVEEAVQAFDRLAIQDTPRSHFIEKFSRNNISRLIAKDIVALAAQDEVAMKELFV